MIERAEDVIDKLNDCLEWLGYVHGPPRLAATSLKLPQVKIPDQVESIKIIHLAASIAALESEC